MPHPFQFQLRGSILSSVGYLLIALAVLSLGCAPPGSTPDDHGSNDHGSNAAAHAHGSDEAAHSHAVPDDHDHDEATSLRLSEQEVANIGLDLLEIRPRPFARTIAVPAEVVHRPGRSREHVTAAFTGLVRNIHCLEGEAVVPGMPLFDLRLTHEDLVQGQADLLQTVEELNVVRREVERVARVTAEGAIAGKTLLEIQYQQHRFEAKLKAQRQRLLLHSLSEEQVQQIIDNRTLLQDMTIRAPQCAGDCACSGLFQVEKLLVDKGQYVTVGDTLCMLADHCELYIEGRALEQDIPALAAAAGAGWKIAAQFETRSGKSNLIEGLDLVYLAAKIDPKSRAYSFFVRLPNELVRDAKSEEGRRFVDWRFKPGQRVRLNVPVEAAVERLVLPAEAVVRDQASWFVFEFVEDHFDRRSVHVEHREPDWVVIAADGSVKPGAQVAVAGAFQIHLATKSKTADVADPHAGHAH